jgi:hypothetical protein
MRPTAPLIAAGVAAALLVGCASPQISDYPVQPPPMSERERDHVRELVSDFSQDRPELPAATELEALDAAQRQRLKEAREPFNYGGGGDTLNEYDRQRLKREESSRSSEYSRGEINAIKRRVNRKYDSHHDIRHELKSKYGL